MADSTDILHAKILIADDREADAFLLEQVLCRAGYGAIHPAVAEFATSDEPLGTK